MNNWENWYNSFLENKRNNELKAFAAALNGENFIIENQPRFDSTSAWSELYSIVKNTDDYNDLNYELNDGVIQSENRLILVCFEKARKINSNYNNDDLLNFLIFKYLKQFEIPNMLSFIKLIKEIPWEFFLECENCGFQNESGWTVCLRCETEIENYQN